MVVVAYGLILPQSVLDMPRLGCLNIHASLLPRWRGAAPIQRAILAGDTRNRRHDHADGRGARHRTDAARALDADSARETAASLHDRLAALGADAVIEAIAQWRDGRIAAAAATRRRRDLRSQDRASREAAIDWTRDAAALDRQVRAFNPRPVAETTWLRAAAARLGGRAGPANDRRCARIGDRDRRAAGRRRWQRAHCR